MEVCGQKKVKRTGLVINSVINKVEKGDLRGRKWLQVEAKNIKLGSEWLEREEQKSFCLSTDEL